MGLFGVLSGIATLVPAQTEFLTRDQREDQLPKIPFTARDLSESVRRYRGYNLPVPPTGARLIRFRMKNPEEDGFGLLVPGPEGLVYRGTVVQPLSRIRSDTSDLLYEEEIKFDDPWIQKRFRLNWGPSNHDPEVDYWAFLIQVAILGHEQLSLTMFPYWYTEVSSPFGGPQWAYSNPRSCVDAIAIKYATALWQSNPEQGATAELLMARASPTMRRIHDQTVISKALEMRIALAQYGIDPQSANGMLAGLARAPRYFGPLDECEAVRPLRKLGAAAAPALIDNFDNPTATPLRVTTSDPFVTMNTTVGEIAKLIFAALPEATQKQALEQQDSSATIDFFSRNLLPNPDGRLAYPNPAAVAFLAKCAPKKLFELTLWSIQGRPDVVPTPMLLALADVHVSIDEPLRRILDQTCSKTLGPLAGQMSSRYEPCEVLLDLVQLRAPPFAKQVLSRIDRMPPENALLSVERLYRYLEPGPALFLALKRQRLDKSILSAGCWERSRWAVEEVPVPSELRTVQNYAYWLISLGEPDSVMHPGTLSAEDWRELRAKINRKFAAREEPKRPSKRRTTPAYLPQNQGSTRMQRAS